MNGEAKEKTKSQKLKNIEEEVRQWQIKRKL